VGKARSAASAAKEGFMRRVSIVVLSFALGCIAGFASFAAGVRFDPAILNGDTKEVSARLLKEAEIIAEKGSWERIAVGRIHYLAGRKDQGKALFDSVLAGKPEASDYTRIATVYAMAGEWDRASELYDKALALKPGSGRILAEAGAWHNLKGDRDKAKELFTASLNADQNDFWDRITIAASYEGQEPF
jgi:tetratricopeptide (TPR) repeat protein